VAPTKTNRIAIRSYSETGYDECEVPQLIWDAIVDVTGPNRSHKYGVTINWPKRVIVLEG
jgi:hypothetical protein